MLGGEDFVGQDQRSRFFSCSKLQGIATIHWHKNEVRSLRNEYSKIREEISTKHPGAKKLFVANSVTISMFQDFDSAVEELLTWKEYHAAWIYRSRPARNLPRNYPLPDFLHPRPNDAPLPGRDPSPHIVGGIVTDDDEQMPENKNASSTCGEAIRPRSDASESEFTNQSSEGENGGPNPARPTKVQL